MDRLKTIEVHILKVYCRVCELYLKKELISPLLNHVAEENYSFPLRTDFQNQTMRVVRWNEIFIYHLDSSIQES